MSQIKTTEIEGDVAVGRNVIAGGNARVRGYMKVGHNLKVEGWLEAPNIKGVNKGLFKAKEELDTTYPYPEPGWIALVGTCLPADVYIANKDGEWIPAGGKSGEVVMDLSGLEGLDGRVDGIEDAVAAERERAEAAESTIESSVATEKARAEVAEADIRTKVEAERERAEASENAIVALVDVEKTRSEAAEAMLLGSITGIGIKEFSRSFESVDDNYMIQYLEDSRNDGSVYYIEDEDAFYRQAACALVRASDYMSGGKPRRLFYRCTDDNLLYRHDGYGLVQFADEKTLASIETSIQGERENRQEGDRILKEMLEKFKAALETGIGAERERAEAAEAELQNGIGRNAALLAEGNIRVFDRTIPNRNMAGFLTSLGAGDIVYSEADNAFYRYLKKVDLGPLSLDGGSTSKGEFMVLPDYMDGDVPDASILFRMRSSAQLYRYDADSANLVRYSDALTATQPGMIDALTAEESEAIAREVFNQG